MSELRSAYCAEHYDTKSDCHKCVPSVREVCWKPIPNPLTLDAIQAHADAVDAAILAYKELAK